MNDRNQNLTKEQICLREAKAIVDRTLKEFPSRVRYDLNIAEEREAVAIMAANIGTQTFAVCMTRPSPKGRQ